MYARHACMPGTLEVSRRSEAGQGILSVAEGIGKYDVVYDVVCIYKRRYYIYTKRQKSVSKMHVFLLVRSFVFVRIPSDAH